MSHLAGVDLETVETRQWLDLSALMIGAEIVERKDCWVWDTTLASTNRSFGEQGLLLEAVKNRLSPRQSDFSYRSVPTCFPVRKSPRRMKCPSDKIRTGESGT